MYTEQTRLCFSVVVVFFNITWGWVKMGYARVLQPATPNTVFSNRASAKARCLYSLPDSEWKWTPHPATVNTSLNSALCIRKHNHCKLNINENPAKGLEFKIAYFFLWFPPHLSASPPPKKTETGGIFSFVSWVTWMPCPQLICLWFHFVSPQGDERINEYRILRRGAVFGFQG